jgi:hypothetical protein
MNPEEPPRCEEESHLPEKLTAFGLTTTNNASLGAQRAPPPRGGPTRKSSAVGGWTPDEVGLFLGCFTVGNGFDFD